MAEYVSNKFKTAILVLVGIMIGGAALIYQKIFGGQIHSLPDKKLIDNPSPQTMNNIQPQEKVAVIRAESPELGVRQVIQQTGNLDFIQPGQKVLVKPNVNSDDPAPGTTDPQALAEVVRLVKTKQAYVIVADRSNPRWNTIPAMKKTGMYQAVSDAGADEIVGFEDEEWIRVKPEKANHWPKGFRIPARLSEIDHIISVPVLHTHSITSHSLALKNLVGLIHPTDRFLFHASPNRDKMITEISLAIKPSLTVIEGTKAFIDGGPSHGTLAHPKVYLASKDILMAEVVGVGLLQKEGAKLFWDDPWSSEQVKRAIELGLSSSTQTELQEEFEKI